MFRCRARNLTSAIWTAAIMTWDGFSSGTAPKELLPAYRHSKCQTGSRTWAKPSTSTREPSLPIRDVELSADLTKTGAASGELQGRIARSTTTELDKFARETVSADDLLNLNNKATRAWRKRLLEEFPGDNFRFVFSRPHSTGKQGFACIQQFGKRVGWSQYSRIWKSQGESYVRRQEQFCGNRKRNPASFSNAHF